MNTSQLKAYESLQDKLQKLDINLLDKIVSQVSKQTSSNIFKDCYNGNYTGMLKVKNALIMTITGYIEHKSISTDLIDYAIKHGRID